MVGKKPALKISKIFSNPIGNIELKFVFGNLKRMLK